MRKVVSIALAAAGVLLWTAPSASACSCAGGDGPQTLRDFDAAINAKLVKVTPTASSENFENDLKYRIWRVFKGARRYGLKQGETFKVRGNPPGASCGLPTREGKAYGLRLYERRGELRSNLCAVLSPRGLRRAAKRSGWTPEPSADCGAAR